jgi:multidrug efflux system membrane fusion protein
MSGQTAPLQPALARETGQVRHRRRRRVLLVLGGLLAVFLGWEGITSVVAYTDDAYVRSDLVAIAPQVTGAVTVVHVLDNQQVHRGDLLVTIDPVPFRLARDAKQATLNGAAAQLKADKDSAAAAQDQLAAANASLVLAQQTERRAAALARDSFESRQALDAAVATLQRAQAQVEQSKAGIERAQQVLARDDAAVAQAQADLATAEWQLGQTELRASVDGAINNLTVRRGDLARVGVPIVGIVDADAWRIMANYKQYYLQDFQVGETAWVWLDCQPWHLHRARIQGIGKGIRRSPDDPSLLPYVAPTTDWIRLQRRFPVTVTLVDPPPDIPLYMGADARVVIFP